MSIESTAPPSGHLWADILMFVGLIAASAFFSSSETALTGASRARMAALEEAGDARAARVNKLRRDEGTMLSTILLGNTFINALASAFAAAVLIRIFGDKGVAIATLFVTAVLVVFAEVMPKTYAMMHADKMALSISGIIAGIIRVFSPVVKGVTHIVRWMFRLMGVGRDTVTTEAQEEELRGAIGLFSATIDAMDPGNIKEKGAMLRSILDLTDLHVEDIMVHRRNVKMISADWPTARLVDEVLHSTFTRLPVWREKPDNIVGVLHAKLLLAELRACDGDITRLNIANAMIEPWFIPESTTLFDQLQEFRRRREHFAIMVDEYGVLRGVITLEDILEEIVGQINDEHDKVVSGVHAQLDGSFIVDGKATIRDINREMSWRLPDEEYATLAGLLLHETQRVPGVGQTFTFYDFRFEVVKRQRNQITSVRVIPPKSPQSEVDAAQG